MSQKWRKFSKEELEKIVNDNVIIKDVARAIGYSDIGGSSILAVKEMIAYYEFDTSHFLGQGWSKNTFDYSRFKRNNAIKSSQALGALVALRGHKCECCHNAEWLGRPIQLEVHHIDGDHLNNEIDNLQLLCPNCHSVTKHWRGKNTSRIDGQISEEQFVKALQNNKNIRKALLSLGLAAAGGNYSTAYNLIEKYNIQHLKR